MTNIFIFIFMACTSEYPQNNVKKDLKSDYLEKGTALFVDNWKYFSKLWTGGDPNKVR